MGIYLNGTTAYTLYKSETVKPYLIIFVLQDREDLEKRLRQI